MLKRGSVLYGTVGSLVVPDTIGSDAVIPGDDEMEDDMKTNVIMNDTLAEETRGVEGLDEGRDGI